MTRRGVPGQSWPAAGGFRVPPALLRIGAGQLNRLALNPRLPWDAQRRRLDRLSRSSPMPRGTTVTERTLGGVRADEVLAGGTSPERTVVHFHGGGYCVGSARLARTWAAHLSAQAACRVILPQYRLAPEHPHPAALDDARDVVRALLNEMTPASIVVSGDSAGGGIALSLLHSMLSGGDELPAGCILICPWADLSADRQAARALVRRDVLLSPRWLQACATAYAQPASWADPAVSPLLGGHAGLPPLLIQAAADDLLAPDARRLAVSAAAAGVDVTYTQWPRMWHDFALQPGVTAAADSALSQAAYFVRRLTRAGQGA